MAHRNKCKGTHVPHTKHHDNTGARAMKTHKNKNIHDQKHMLREQTLKPCAHNRRQNTEHECLELDPEPKPIASFFSFGYISTDCFFVPEALSDPGFIFQWKRPLPCDSSCLNFHSNKFGNKMWETNKFGYKMMETSWTSTMRKTCALFRLHKAYLIGLEPTHLHGGLQTRVSCLVRHGQTCV